MGQKLVDRWQLTAFSLVTGRWPFENKTKRLFFLLMFMRGKCDIIETS